MEGRKEGDTRVTKHQRLALNLNNAYRRHYLNCNKYTYTYIYIHIYIYPCIYKYKYWFKVFQIFFSFFLFSFFFLPFLQENQVYNFSILFCFLFSYFPPIPSSSSFFFSSTFLFKEANPVLLFPIPFPFINNVSNTPKTINIHNGIPIQGNTATHSRDFGRQCPR